MGLNISESNINFPFIDQNLDIKNIKENEIYKIIDCLENNLSSMNSTNTEKIILFMKHIKNCSQGANFTERLDKIISIVEQKFKSIYSNLLVLSTLQNEEMIKEAIGKANEEELVNSFFYFIRGNDKTNLEIFLKYKPELINKLNADGASPLSIAVLAGNIDLVKFFIKKGSDCRYANKEGENLIYQAAAINSPNILNELIQAGLDINFVSKGIDPALISACKKKSHSVIEFLIKFGANVDITDNNEDTPIMWVINRQDKEALEILLNNKVDINKQTLNLSPLFFALMTNFSMALRLIEAGADINFISKEGLTILELNDIQNNLSFAEIKEQKKILIEKGANPAISDHILQKKYLAHIWGLKGFFSVNNISISLEGMFNYYGIEKLSFTFLDYLSFLKEKFPNFIDSDVEKKLISCNLQLLLNYNLKETSAEKIIFESQKYPQVLSAGWQKGKARHATAVVLYQDKLVKCNRGDARGKFALSAYQIRANLTPEIIDKIRQALDMSFFNEEIDRLLDLNLIVGKELSNQKAGNCTWASAKVAELAVLELLKDESKNGFDKDLDITRQIYKAFTSFTREKELENYFKRIQTHPDEIDWGILSTIRNKLENKISSNKFFTVQRENFEKAWAHFDTYLVQDLIKLPSNSNQIFNYFNAIDFNEKKIKEYLIKLKSEPNTISWLTLARIRQEIEKKLSTTMISDLRKKNWEQAIIHFDTEITPELFVARKQNEKQFLYATDFNETYVKNYINKIQDSNCKFNWEDLAEIRELLNKKLNYKTLSNSQKEKYELGLEHLDNLPFEQLNFPKKPYKILNYFIATKFNEGLLKNYFLDLQNNPEKNHWHILFKIKNKLNQYISSNDFSENQKDVFKRAINNYDANLKSELLNLPIEESFVYAFVNNFNETFIEKLLKKMNENNSFDWEALSKIVIELNNKLASLDYNNIQKENFQKALKHFETYVTPEKFTLPSNDRRILSYLIAINNRDGIQQYLKSANLDIFFPLPLSLDFELKIPKMYWNTMIFLIDEDLALNSSKYSKEILEDRASRKATYKLYEAN